ncbi:VacJ family lipoprotein [Methylomarinum sp. Ch1-1]|uniref:VacJ family lipoprotein n=2 Tax=Methylomarinum roseum TaxID=3067653 RepID=A0AAU7P158_9GAMM|nr:VacJ family lipoprotein [Methylomarinum sp. Ch1-1]MDP4520127.1 VacJ family lipoprotein [Methylomarinum sp. Ch1-1]
MVSENLQNKNISGALLALMVAVALSLSGCAGTQVAEQEAVAEEVVTEAVAEAEASKTDELETDVVEQEDEVDPYEGFNRKVFVFNDKLDTYVAKPISDAYLWVTPEFVQTGVANFFSNLKDINVVLNDVMQGKLQQGLEDTGRFTMNSTVGLLGLFDVAKEVGLEKHEEDFDQTLAVWGVPEGPYLVLPILGPTTSRGLPGGVFDAAANPTTYVGLPVQLIAMLNARANAEGALKFIDEAALDPYVFTRESFLQYRRNLVADGKIDISDDVFDLEDEFYEEELYEEEGGNGADITEQQQTAEVEEDIDLISDQQPQEVVTTVDVAENKLAQAEGFKLRLSADIEEFDQASGSFDSAVRSFDEATRSFEQAVEKLDRLENN